LVLRSRSTTIPVLQFRRISKTNPGSIDSGNCTS
jgi:hypothetical protein